MATLLEDMFCSRSGVKNLSMGTDVSEASVQEQSDLGLH